MESRVNDRQETVNRQAVQTVLDALREAGGGILNRDDAVTREGRRYVIPANSTLREASKFLRTLADAQEEETAYGRVYTARPWDGAYCAHRAMKEAFGAVQAVATFGFFGKEPPEMRSVHTGPDEVTQIPWGTFELPGLLGCKITFGGVNDKERGPLFSVGVIGAKKYQAEVEGLLNLIEEACKRYSIYKGKAFDGGDQPEFLRIEIDPAKVVYTGDVELQLQANVWSVIEDSELQRKAGLPLKRSVLLHGPYGTGKSLFLGLTAAKANEHGWTYIRCRPGKDTYAKCLQTAALYAPAVVAFEDVDTLASADANGTDVSQLLDAFDGVTAKGVEIIGLLTTNHPERIHKGMVRPGRLDAVIEIAALDAEAISRLVRALVPADMLAPDVDLAAVSGAMHGYMPAFIREATDRAIRYAISRAKRLHGVTIDTEDLVNAAHGLRAQLTLMEGASDHQGYQPPLDRTLRNMFAETVQTMFTEKVLIASAEEVDSLDV